MEGLLIVLDIIMSCVMDIRLCGRVMDGMVIRKYRNQTFKVKGKVNKSGPKGVGDGSFRYLYIESRADK